MPSDYSREQLAVRTNFDNLTQKYKQAYPLDYYVLRPMRYLKMIVLHSNTAHIFYFQEEFRNNTLLNILRFLLVLFHILLYLLIPINLFLLWRKKEVFIIVIIPLIFILFLIFPFQAIEQRYMLPFLPFLFLGIYPISEQIIHQFKKNANT